MSVASVPSMERNGAGTFQLEVLNTLHEIRTDQLSHAATLNELRLEQKTQGEAIRGLASKDKGHERAIATLRKPWQEATRKMGVSLILLLSGAMAYAAQDLARRSGSGPQSTSASVKQPSP